jgi:hypothetical protein
MQMLQPGDRIVSPRGEEMYAEPRFIVPGQAAWAFVLNGRAVGVLVLRTGAAAKLRCCDGEGRVHDETLMAPSEDVAIGMAVQRMALVTAHFLGERHPLTRAATANATAA